MTSLRSLVRFLEFEGRCRSGLSQAWPRVPIWKQSPPSDVLTAKECSDLLRCVDRHCPSGQRDFAILRLMTDLGLRGAEIVELCLEDIDWRASTLAVRKNKQRRERLLPLLPLVAKAILNYLRTGRPSSSNRRLFLCHRLPVGQPMTSERLRGAVRRIMQRAGLTGGGQHRLRHSFATRLHARGGLAQRGGRRSRPSGFRYDRHLRSSELVATAEGRSAVAENSPMKPSDSMLRRVEDYLRYRRALGYALRIEGGMLLNFARFADKDGHRGPLTCDLAARWARLPATPDRLYWARRIEVLIGFARYCKIFDSRTEIPPRHIFGSAHRRKTPYIYSCRQLEELVFAARQLNWDGKMHTYATLFGLLACTGLRISEALGLRRDQVDLKQGILTIKESKDADFVWYLYTPQPCRRLKSMLPSESSAFLRPLSFSSTAAAIALPTRPCAPRFENSRCCLAGSKTANALASTTYVIRLLAVFFLNGALAMPDEKTASTGCPTISVTSACPTLIGIFQLLRNSLPLR
jgi:integrase